MAAEPKDMTDEIKETTSTEAEAAAETAADTSVAVAVSTPHRQQAFEAGKWLIDTLKEVVPIWKKENWADGASEWVHPGVDPK